MRRRAQCAAAILLLVGASLYAQDSVEKTRERAATSKPADCAKVCFEAARQLIEASNQLYSGGDAQQGLKLMKDALSYAQRGTEASIESHKNQKGAEIALRKMAKRMHDVGESLSLDDRPPVFQIEKSVQDLRDKMLAAIFGSPKKTLEGKQ